MCPRHQYVGMTICADEYNLIQRLFQYKSVVCGMDAGREFRGEFIVCRQLMGEVSQP